MKVYFDKILGEVRGAWRFRWLALIVAWGVCVVGWGVVLGLADTYEASARVFVDTRTALSRATEGLAVTSDIDSQLQRVREALFGGPQLEEVVRKENLLTSGATPRERQNLITGMRDRIKIDARGAGLFVISFRDHNRDLSLRVVDRVLNNFVEGSLGGKREGSEQAQRFLNDQIAEYENKLAMAEQRRAEFKKQNVGLMPGVQGDYFSRLQSEMEGLNRAEADMDIAKSKRDELQRQLRGEQPVTSSGASTAAGSNDIASRIRETQTQLDDLLLRFTEKHPDVIARRATLEELKQRQQSELDAVRRGDAGAAARMGLGSNPVFQGIQQQLNLTDVEIAALRGTIAERRTRVGELRKLVDTAPDIEAEFARLNRDYDVTSKQYQDLVQRLGQTRLSQEAEETGIVRFDIIDPPSASFKPVAPNRPLLLIGILFAGLAAGGGLAYVLHQMKPIFSSVRQLNEITGLPVLGVVSMTWLEKHRLTRRKEALIYSGALGMLMVVGGLMFLLHPRVMQLIQRWAG